MSKSSSSLKGYVGTYTKGDSVGIYSFTLNTEIPEIKDVQVAAELGNPTYLTISQDNQYLYSVIKEGDKGGVAAYSISDQGELHLLNSQLTEGASPCHVSVDNEKNYVVTANYHKGTVELYPVNKENGSVSPASSTVQHEGFGPNKDRQEKPHVHYSGFTPDEKYIAVIDLGIDKLITYANNDGVLEEVSSLSVHPGSGPRHLEFHPNGKYAYLMTELSSEVIVLSYDSEKGSFKDIQYISTIPADFTANNQGSAIHVTADGQFVYVSNRGHNSIAVFSVDKESGKLTFIEHTSTEGDWPRDFVLDPSERFVVASNQESGNLVLYTRDAATGKLTLVQSDIAVPYPVCVKFLK
ncbi:6-phosphogluconolactonase [Heyndrickxia sporothermodurans]|uniref:lactonase family protein n=1 Tax=Heyndrickxia sporothermodurans TaxID=46224 RepID=UPI000D3BFABF|nr:lactonase family protein [Heyndrickxia sporothermodurans]PTY77218.1 6-phosphogluconolactonase [Heyndrickxia sporothermodurans]